MVLGSAGILQLCPICPVISTRGWTSAYLELRFDGVSLLCDLNKIDMGINRKADSPYKVLRLLSMLGEHYLSNKPYYEIMWKHCFHFISFERFEDNPLCCIGKSDLSGKTYQSSQIYASSVFVPYFRLKSNAVEDWETGKCRGGHLE